MQVHRKGGVRTQWKVAIYKIRTQAIQDTNPANIFILDFQPQHSEKINLCCLIHSFCQVLLWQPLANQYTPPPLWVEHALSLPWSMEY